MSPSRQARAGSRPFSTTGALAASLGDCSWSVASSSASSLIVTFGAPASRSTSRRSPGSPVMARGCSVRVTVSGLYWNTITPTIVLVTGLSWTRPPRTSFGEPGKVVIGPPGVELA